MLIHVANLNCRLYEVPRDLLPRIDHWFRVRQPNYWFNKAVREGRWDGYFHFFKIHNGVLPTGLLEILLTYLWQGGHTDVQLVDKRTNCPTLRPLKKLTGITLRDYQLGALEEAVERRLTIGSFPRIPLPRGIVRLPTGSGKTEIIAGICQRITGQGLVLVHQRDLLHQTRERISTRIGEEAGIIGDSIVEPRRVTISTVQTLSRHLKHYAPWLQKQAFFISDEGHHLGAARTFRQVADVCPAYVRLAFSATPFVTGDPVQQMRLMASTGPIIYTLEPQDLVAADVIAPVSICVQPITTPTAVVLSSASSAITRPSAQLPYGGKNGAYQKLIVENTTRNAAIVSYAKDADGPVLIIVTRIDHGKRLAAALDCPFLWGGDNSALRKRTLKELGNGRLRMVVASPIFDEGVDAPAIQTLILAAGGKSDIKLLQRIGRGMRRKKGGRHLDVLDFLDGTNPYLLRHSEFRVTAAQKAGFTVRLKGEQNDD